MTRSLPLLALCLLSLPALAQRADPVDDASPVGYEVSLHGALAIERGSALQVTGVAYEVQGLAALRPTPGLAIEAAVVERTPTETSRVVVQAQAQSGAGGRFEVSLPMPRRGVASPRLELRVHRRGQPARRFEWPLVERAPETLDLLTDRQRYQPGEHVRVWVRVRNVRSEVPSSDASVRLELADPDGRVAAEHSGTTRASGVISAELVIPAQSVTGSWTVRARVEGEPPGPTAERSIEVLRRTVERLLARVELAGGDDDHDAVVVPGQLLRGRVVVTTPSGTPIPNAQVELRVREDAPIEPLRTDAGGIATFASRAPSFLSGEVGHEQVLARIVHPAYGSVLASAPYLLVRVRALASATPESGALVPEVPSILYVAITDPRGRPLPAGTVIEARGRGVRGGRFSGPIDVEGQLEVPMLVPRGAASRAVSGTCAGSIATAVELEIRTDPPVISRLCAFVAADAEVLPRLAGPNVVPAGSRVTVTLARRPSARGRAVLVEGLFEGRAVAAAWAEGAQTQVDLTLPGDVVGVVSLRARPVQTPDARAPLSERGAALLGRGASTAVLTRPADVFSLEVRPAQPRWRVRERARVDLRASRAPSAGWVALLARDEAAHGGEEPWELRWLRRELHDAIRELAASSAPSEAHARLVQVALHAGLSAEAEMPSPPPLDPAYWDPRPHPYYDPSLSIAFGVLRDPIAMRELYLRQQLGQVEMALERAVEGLGADPRERAPIVSSGARVAFHPDVVAHLVRSHRLSDSLARTLGGQPIRADMIQAFDGAFTFDAVAKRVARRRLARLMQAVLRLTDPDDPEAQRVSASLPPERWLSTLVQLGVVRQGDLLDPWGRPFVLRATPSPRLVLSDRATGYELASPGPDGRPGTGDDVRDPFARVVPEGSLYAIASGEDALMRRLAAASPATAVLSQLSGAYARLALAAQEEQRASVVDASTTEEADEVTARAMPATAAPPPAPEPAMMPGGGAGYRRRAMEQEAAAAADEDAEGRLDAQFAQRMPAAQSVAAAARAESLAAIVREDFPATLFFAGEVPLDGAEAHVEVPLADALTTYHLEAIAWTSSGWTTSARARISVDQDAMVDAPIPPELTAGDHARVPVRVENRTDAAFRVRASASTEGELALEIAPIAVLEVPAHDAVEALVEVHARAVGSGTVLLQIATEDGRPLDAVRRPLTVLADARIARDERELLIDRQGVLRVEVPSRASARGAAEVRVALGRDLFGPPEAIEEPMALAWVLAMTGEPLTEAAAQAVFGVLGEDSQPSWFPPQLVAAALGAAWGEARLPDDRAALALRTISAPLSDERATLEDVQALLALVPAFEHADRRPALRGDLVRLRDRLRRSVARAASEAETSSPLAAAALALTQRGDPRAQEILRRAERERVELDDALWIEAEDAGRDLATAGYALARVARGERAEAMRALRGLRLIDREGDLQGAEARAIAMACAARLAPRALGGEPRVHAGGVPIVLRREGSVWVGALPGWGAPGVHEASVQLPEGAVAVLTYQNRYGLPWDEPPARRAPFALSLEGEVGARDARAGLLLSVRNEGTRFWSRPVAEVELPGGVELDELTREQLAEHLAGPARQEGRTLVLPLRPLAPRGFARLPLPLRWSIGGSLRGLGAVAYDATTTSDVRPLAILPSREVRIADRGAEPERPDAELSPLPPPIPPIPVLDRLLPGEVVQ